MSLENPLTRKEIKELDRLLSSQERLEKLVAQTIRGRKFERRIETAKVAQRTGKHT